MTITSPLRGETRDGTHTLAWSGMDADGDALAYAAQYSPDDGDTWYPLAVGARQPEFTFDTFRSQCRSARAPRRPFRLCRRMPRRPWQLAPIRRPSV